MPMKYLVEKKKKKDQEIDMLKRNLEVYTDFNMQKHEINQTINLKA